MLIYLQLTIVHVAEVTHDPSRCFTLTTSRWEASAHCIQNHLQDSSISRICLIWLPLNQTLIVQEKKAGTDSKSPSNFPCVLFQENSITINVGEMRPCTEWVQGPLQNEADTELWRSAAWGLIPNTFLHPTNSILDLPTSVRHWPLPSDSCHLLSWFQPAALAPQEYIKHRFWQQVWGIYLSALRKETTQWDQVTINYNCYRCSPSTEYDCTYRSDCAAQEMWFTTYS